MRLTTLLVLLLLMQNSAADWAALSDKALLAADSVVYGQYQGQAALKTRQQELPVNLGVIRASKIIKGRRDSPVIFIERYNPKGLFRSDMLHFKVGQTGLWFLNLVPNTEGFYQLTHPSQSKAIAKDSPELQRWQQQLK